MSSPLTTATDFYLLLLPAIFGFVFAFVLGLAVYQCATLSRVKGTYTKRNRVLRSRLAHSLDYCDAHNVTSVYDTLRDLGYDNLYDTDRDGESGHKSRGSGGSNSNGKRKGRDEVDSADEESHESRGRASRSASHRHYPSEHSRGNGSSQSASSFVLDEVRMLDSDEYSNES